MDVRASKGDPSRDGERKPYLVRLPGFVSDEEVGLAAPLEGSYNSTGVRDFLRNYGEAVIPQQAGTVPKEAVEGRRPCPWGCYEANVACTVGLLWNTCWCRQNGRTCPVAGWWVAGPCLGYWKHGCI